MDASQAVFFNVNQMRKARKSAKKTERSDLFKSYKSDNRSYAKTIKFTKDINATSVNPIE
jgi:hypothetical protein